MLKLTRLLKNLIIFIRPHVYLGFLQKPFMSFSNTLYLSKWVSTHKSEPGINDFPVFSRNYNKRLDLYKYILDKYHLSEVKLSYYEFGVSQGHSFRWWLSHNTNPQSLFYGFDTFEGLPEDWGHFEKGAMKADIINFNDNRAHFVKGLFQDSLFDFIKHNPLPESNARIFHMDADLFSSTLFCLTSLAPYFKKGDIILFDEFNVPNHEVYALNIFAQSYYFKYKLVGAVNNFYQIAIEVL